MPTQFPVTVTFSNKPACKLKAESIEHARKVVCEELGLRKFTSEALGDKHVLYIHILLNGNNHKVEEEPSDHVNVAARHPKKKVLDPKSKKK